MPEESRPPGAERFVDAGRVLVTTRTTCAWAALGHAVSAYDTALTYTKQRRQFGQPLCSFQIVQDRLVKMRAKLNNTRKASQVIADARDLLGGNGVLLDNHIRHMGDIEVIHTYEGIETMQTLIVGRDITGVGTFT